jgi:hypothetical protein
MTYLVIGGAFVLGVGVGVVVAAADWCARWERERGGYVDLTQMPYLGDPYDRGVTVRKLP